MLQTLARPCGKVVVVDEDVMSHAQLGNDNLLIVPGMTDGVLEVEADHLVLLLDKELLHSLDGSLHQDQIVRVHYRESLPPHVGVHDMLHGELPAVSLSVAGSAIGATGIAIGTAGCPLCMCRRGCAYCLVRRERYKVNGRKNKWGPGGLDSLRVRM